MRAELSQVPAVARLIAHLFGEPVACLLAVAVFVAVIALGAGGMV